MKLRSFLAAFLLLGVTACGAPANTREEAEVTTTVPEYEAGATITGPLVEDAHAFFLPAELWERITAEGAHHTRHWELFSPYMRDDLLINRLTLMGVDGINARFPDGGTYSLDAAATPTRWDMDLFGQPLSQGFNKTSYCTGAAYGAFIATLNLLWPGGLGTSMREVMGDNFNALGMQRLTPAGQLTMRDDYDGIWGWFNGASPFTAVVRLLEIGKGVAPHQLQPGDLVQIWRWKRNDRTSFGSGHQVVFLGYRKDADDKIFMVYWSSNRGTNGYGFQEEPLDDFAYVEGVRLTSTERLAGFDAGNSKGVVPGWDKNLLRPGFLNAAELARIRASSAFTR